MERKKLLFRGVFNYGSLSERRFAYAYSGRQAKIFMMQQMAKEQGVDFKIVASKFDGSQKNFDIRLEEK